MLAKTGRVVFPGILGPTATNPSWSFFSRDRKPHSDSCGYLAVWSAVLLLTVVKDIKTVVTAEDADMWKESHKHLYGLGLRPS